MKRARLILGMTLILGFFAGLVSSTGCRVNSTSDEPAPSKQSQQTSAPIEAAPIKRAGVEEKATVAANLQGDDQRKKESRSNDVVNIAEDKHREIFSAVVALELQGLSCPDACVVVAKQYGIAVDTAGKISMEGTRKGWPRP